MAINYRTISPTEAVKEGLSFQRSPDSIPGSSGSLSSVAWGGAPPTADQLQRQAQQAQRAQPAPTYGSYTIDPSGKLVPIGAGGPPQTPLYKQPSGNYSYINPGGGVLPGGPGSSVNSWTVPPPGAGGGSPQYDPAAMYNQGPTGGLPPLNTGGVNPYLTDPLMAGYRGQQNPLYMNQNPQDFYGDPELFGGGGY